MRRLAILFAALALVAGFAPAADAADSNPDPRIAVHTDGTSYLCSGPQDMLLVRVINPRDDAIQANAGCTGTIARIEVETQTLDGVKIKNAGAVAHDLVIGGGYIRCTGIGSGAHQDGVQAMGGIRITFRKLAIDCLGNSNFYVNKGGSNASTPTAVVCDGCALGGHSGQTVFIAESVASGVRNSLISQGRFQAFRIGNSPDNPLQLVNEGNTTVGSGTTWQQLLDYVGMQAPRPPDPEPDPEPGPVCDAACVDGYEKALAFRDARIAELESRVGELLGEVAKRDALLAQIHDLSG